MGKYGQRARALHDEKYNCVQSVVLAFDDVLGVERHTLAKLVANLGGGLGYGGEVCGALSGVAIISGFFGGWDIPTDLDSKKISYDTIKGLVEEFREGMGATRCPELLEMRYKGVRECTDIMEFAADLVAEKMGLE